MEWKPIKKELDYPINSSWPIIRKGTSFTIKKNGSIAVIRHVNW
jgi:hypothetical protein